MSVSEKASSAIKIGKSDTAANSLSALFTHVHQLHRYAGSLQTDLPPLKGKKSMAGSRSMKFTHNVD